jgi:hypothetical protein
MATKPWAAVRTSLAIGPGTSRLSASGKIPSMLRDPDDRRVGSGGLGWEVAAARRRDHPRDVDVVLDGDQGAGPAVLVERDVRAVPRQLLGPSHNVGRIHVRSFGWWSVGLIRPGAT